MDIFSLPQCPHLHSNYCTFATNKVGSLVHVTGPVCNVTCKMHGPYCGKQISDTQTSKFVEKMMLLQFGETMEKVKKRYRKPIKVLIPTIKKDLMESLGPVLNLPYVKTACLTGSILGGNLPHKDLDILLVVSDLKQFIDNKEEIDKLIPKSIKGFLVDIFVSEQCATFFMTLDLKTDILYTNANYNITEMDPNIKKVVKTEFHEHYKDIWFFKEDLPEDQK